MARAADYYEKELNKQKPIEPVEIPQTATTVLPKVNQLNVNRPDTSQMTMDQSTRDRLINVQNEQNQRSERLGISQDQIESNINKVLEKGAYDEALFTQGRSLGQSLSYEMANMLFNIPDQQTWAGMSPWEKTKIIGKEAPKTTWRFIKALPAEIAKAPIRAGLSFVEMEREALTGAKSLITGEKRDEPRRLSLFNGSVKSYASSFEEGIEMGLPPLAAAIKSTGEIAGDFAISSSMTKALNATIFSPRVVTVATKPGRVPDFRPLTAEQTQSIGSKLPASTKSISYEAAKQNPNVSYFGLPKSVAAQYGGNANNTFLKVIPKNSGNVKLTIVQRRSSLWNQAIDALRAKFGKSRVVPGENGPELILDSINMRYNPQALMTKPSGIGSELTKVSTQGKMPSMKSVLGSMGAKATPQITASEAYQFYSPNVEENLNFDQALTASKSGNQLLYKRITDDIDSQLGYKNKSYTAIGDWSDGAENSIFNEIEKVNSFDELKYNAALKGKIGKQKSVIAFMVDNTGKDSLFQTVVKESDLDKLRSNLDEAGIQFRTLIPEKGQTRIAIFDPGSSMIETIQKFADKYSLEIDHKLGQGEFLGDDNSREIGVKKFEEFIKQYESQSGVTKYQEQVTTESLANSFDPFIQIKSKQKNMVDKNGQPIMSVVQKPLKGFENSLVTDKQVGQVLNISSAKNLPDDVLQAITQVVASKDSLFELTQQEAFDVSEMIRMFGNQKDVPRADWMAINISYSNPARYWMHSAENEFGVPVYTDIYQAMEKSVRLKGIADESKMSESREIFGKYAEPSQLENRRLIDQYTRGNKDAILKNNNLDNDTKMELSKIGDWLIERYKELHKMEGIQSSRFFGEYAPSLAKSDGIRNLYKNLDELPLEINPFFHKERGGILSPLEDDALALYDLYIRMVNKNKFLGPVIENARNIIPKAPPRVQKAVNDYIQEKLGFQDSFSESFNKMGEKLSKYSNGLLPEDISKQFFNAIMTTSYAGALGLPRIVPILRDSVQPLLTSYPELGEKWFTAGLKAYIKNPKAWIKELRDKGMLVELGVPYGAELATQSKSSFVGKAINKYLDLNKLMMKPYASIDSQNRAITYAGAKIRFYDAWEKFADGKISYTDFANQIDLNSYPDLLKKMVDDKLSLNTKEGVDEAFDLLAVDLLDRTQFPYRKGSQSRAHYGLKGKLGLQFAQWSWEYIFTLKNWVAKGQWDKLIRWYASSAVVIRSMDETFDIDARDWMATGPFTGFPLGPIAKIGASAIAGFNAAMTGMDDDLNRHYKDIVNSLKIFGGTLTGVGTQRITRFMESIKRYEAGISVSSDPEKPFGIWSTTGKLIDWVDFSTLFKNLLGFNVKSSREQSERISIAKKDQIEYNMMVNKAMNYLIDGNFEKFDKYVTDNEILIPDLATKMKSYNIPLDQRIFERLPAQLKMKYINVFYPVVE